MKKQNRAIVITGYIGLKGTATLANLFDEKINQKYPLFLSREAKQFAENLDEDEKKVKDMLESFESRGEENTILTIGNGGFLSAMWELAKEIECGFTVDLRLVPIKQETVEICELLEVNPYHLCSFGCLAVVTSSGNLLVEQLKKEGINATIIGYTNATKAHILMNDGTQSHLNRPEADEIDRFIK